MKLEIRVTEYVQLKEIRLCRVSKSFYERELIEFNLAFPLWLHLLFTVKKIIFFYDVN